eukprot:4810532-Amphidinium_carterae.2
MHYNCKGAFLSKASPRSNPLHCGSVILPLVWVHLVISAAEMLVHAPCWFSAAHSSLSCPVQECSSYDPPHSVSMWSFAVSAQNWAEARLWNPEGLCCSVEVAAFLVTPPCGLVGLPKHQHILHRAEATRWPDLE